MSENTIPESFKMTELGLLPEEWGVVKLGDIANFKNGINFTKDQKGKSGILTIDVFNMYSEGVYVNLNNLYRVNKQINDDYLLQNGDILFVRSSLKREGVGWTSLFRETQEPVTFCGFVIRARLKSDSISPEFLTNYLRTNNARENLIASSGKVAITNINQGMLGRISAPLPPLPEQQKIAEVLSTVQQAREKTNAVISATKELKKSLMKHLFTHGPVPVKKFDEFNEFNELRVDELQNAQNSKNSSNSSNSSNSINLKETEIGLVPEEWDVVKLGDVFEVKQGKQLSSKEKTDGKIRKSFLRTSNISWGKIDITKVDEMPFTKEEFSKLKLKENDILVCEGGDIGRTALYREEVKDCAYQNHIHRLRPKDRNVENLFFVLWMEHAIKQRGMYIHQGNVTTIPNLSSSRLKSFKIPLPPLPTQQKIATILSAVDKKIEAEETKRKSLDELFKSLLQNIMTGKLRVTEL